MKDLPALCAPLQESNVNIYADTLAYASLQGHYPAELLKEATEEDFGTEFLDYKLAVKVVEGMDSAIAHSTSKYVPTQRMYRNRRQRTCDWFCREVDAACVYVNRPDFLYRRRTVRTGCGNRHQHTEAACPRSYGFRGNHHVQVDY